MGWSMREKILDICNHVISAYAFERDHWGKEPAFAKARAIKAAIQKIDEMFPFSGDEEECAACGWIGENLITLEGGMNVCPLCASAVYGGHSNMPKNEDLQEMLGMFCHAMNILLEKVGSGR